MWKGVRVGMAREVWCGVPGHVQQGQQDLQLHPESTPEHSGESSSVLLPPHHGWSLSSSAGSSWRLGLGGWSHCLCSGLQHWSTREESSGSIRIPGTLHPARLQHSHCSQTYLMT